MSECFDRLKMSVTETREYVSIVVGNNGAGGRMVDRKKVSLTGSGLEVAEKAEG